MTSRRPTKPVERPSFATPDLDAAIARAEGSAVIIWRGEPVPMATVPERISGLGLREERDRFLNGYIQALEALNPLYEERRQRRRETAAAAGVADVVDAAGDGVTDPRALAVDLERFSLHTETPYFAALRRYLALVDIEQGDATIADLWHVVRGVRWSHWFAEREVRRAVAAAGRVATATLELDGWRSAERLLYAAPDGADPTVAAALSETYSALPGDPHWLEAELGVATQDVAQVADFVAFVRLWRFRRAVALLHYELRLYREDDPVLLRAYFAGILSHTIGVDVPEAMYLHDVGPPLASVRRLQVLMLSGTIAEVLESRMGPAWWRSAAATEILGQLRSASSVQHALALLGYNALDWRPVLRHIRTRLIGEMSGYGGPNITTRAGTRKV